ncbi:MAG: hypothetical protein ACRDFA_10900 [bacterium]
MDRDITRLEADAKITAQLRGPTGLRSIILVGLNAEASDAFTRALEGVD